MKNIKYETYDTVRLWDHSLQFGRRRTTGWNQSNITQTTNVLAGHTATSTWRRHRVSGMMTAKSIVRLARYLCMRWKARCVIAGSG